MSFLGKVYKYDKGENFEEFVDQLDLSPESKQGYKQTKAEQKLVQNADGSYTLSIIAPGLQKTTTFKSGVEFDEEYAPGKYMKSTFVLNGNVLIHEQKPNTGKVVKFIREFTDSVMKVTYTVSGWNGTAIRYYKA